MFVNANQYKTAKSDAEMIQAAIDEAARFGKSVVVSSHNERTGKDVWEIDSALVLRAGTIIILQNCHLRLADGAVCNMFTNSLAQSETIIPAMEWERGIHILGIGNAILDGGNHNQMYENNGIARKVMKPSEHHITENCMMRFRYVTKMVIENITVRNQRYWGIWFRAASFCRVSGIHFETDGNIPNQDGVDLSKGCHDFIVENITGRIGDDSVAINVTDNEIYHDTYENKRDGDVYNVTIRNIMTCSTSGCGMIRLLNHDGYRIYNIRIDNVMEISPWSDSDKVLATNPDLIIKTDDDGNLLPFEKLNLGDEGYRMEAAIRIGESYWYAHSKAQHGDTYGISVSNVMTHSRFGISINNTLQDATFDNIRVFGNGHMAAYMGEGTVENVKFSNIHFDKTAKPHPDDEHIYVEWNQTRSDGFHAVGFNKTNLKNVTFDGVELNGDGMEAVFCGNGCGTIGYSRIRAGEARLSALEGVKLEER